MYIDDSWSLSGPSEIDSHAVSDTGLSAEQSLIQTGFHYPDWIVDGDDLLCLVRTAYRGAVNAHDSNRITLKRVTNFRQLVTSESVGEEKQAVDAMLV